MNFPSHGKYLILTFLLSNSHALYILKEQRNCEILILLQIYKNDQKSKFMLTST